MADLVEFLRARLDEDERVALAAAQTSNGGKPRYTRWDTSEWHGGDEPAALVGQGTPTQPLALGHFIHSTIPRRHAEHICHHDPGRVLAQVAAYREILDEHQPISDGRTLRPGGESLVCSTCTAPGQRDERAPYPCLTLRALASVYAGREGWREEWMPSG